MAYRLNIIELDKVPAPEEFLNKRELETYKAFKIDKRKREWLGGRYALKKLACDFFNFDIKYMEVKNLPSGQPVLLVPGGTKLPVSITHSGTYAAAAIALTGQAIGLDIEIIEQRSPAWIKQCFDKREISSKSAPFLTELWAKKESILKLLQIGLVVPAKDIEITGGEIHYYNKALDVWALRGSPKIAFETKNLDGGYKLVVAYPDII